MIQSLRANKVFITDTGRPDEYTAIIREKGIQLYTV
jgi:hypothetical protein